LNPRLFQSIARKVTKELNIRTGAATPEQVACVANGTERTVSHPVIAAIMSELRRHKIKIP